MGIKNRYEINSFAQINNKALCYMANNTANKLPAKNSADKLFKKLITLWLPH